MRKMRDDRTAGVSILPGQWTCLSILVSSCNPPTTTTWDEWKQNKMRECVLHYEESTKLPPYLSPHPTYPPSTSHKRKKNDC